jgi:hypothetical protein
MDMKVKERFSTTRECRHQNQPPPTSRTRLFDSTLECTCIKSLLRCNRCSQSIHTYNDACASITCLPNRTQPSEGTCRPSGSLAGQMPVCYQWKTSCRIISLCDHGGNASVLIRSQKQGSNQTSEAQSTGLDIQRRSSASLLGTRSGGSGCGTLATRVRNGANASVLALNTSGSTFLVVHGLEILVASILDITSGLDVEGTSDIGERRQRNPAFD